MDRKTVEAYTGMMSDEQKKALIRLGDEPRQWVAASDLPGGDGAGMRLVALSLATFFGRRGRRKFSITSRGRSVRGRIRLEESLALLDNMEVDGG